MKINKRLVTLKRLDKYYKMLNILKGCRPKSDFKNEKIQLKVQKPYLYPNNYIEDIAFQLQKREYQNDLIC